MGILLTQAQFDLANLLTWEDIVDALTGKRVLDVGRNYYISYRAAYFIRKNEQTGLAGWVQRGDPDGPPDWRTIITDLDQHGQNFVEANPDAWLGPEEILIIRAIAEHEFSSEAKSLLFPQDYIIWDPAIDSGTPAAGPYPIPNPEPLPHYMGIIRYRKDMELQLSAYYDWRSVQFARWRRTPITESYLVDPSTTSYQAVEVGPSNIPELNKLHSWFETGETLFSAGNNALTPITVNDTTMAPNHYFTFGGPAVYTTGMIQINPCIELASNWYTYMTSETHEYENLPASSGYNFCFNVPKNDDFYLSSNQLNTLLNNYDPSEQDFIDVSRLYANQVYFRNISIGRGKRQVLCGEDRGQMPTSLTGYPAYGSGTLEDLIDTNLLGFEPGGMPGQTYCYPAYAYLAYGAVIESDLQYQKERNNIVFLLPNTKWDGTRWVVNTCCNISIGDNNIRNTIDGDNFRDCTIGNDFSNNIILSRQPNNNLSSLYGFSYPVGADGYNVATYLPCDFKGNKIGNNFSNNLILCPMMNNTIGDNFTGNIIESQIVWNTIEERPARVVSHNTLADGFSYNEITQSLIGTDCMSVFTNNKIIASNPVPGDLYNKLMDSDVIDCKFYAKVNDTVFTVVHETSAQTVWTGFLGPMQGKTIYDSAPMFASALSTFETVLLFPQSTLTPDVLELNNLSFKSVGKIHLKPSDPSALGIGNSILQLNKVSGIGIPHNFILNPVAAKTDSIWFIGNSGAELVNYFDLDLQNNLNPLTQNIAPDGITPDPWKFGIVPEIPNATTTVSYRDRSNRVWYGFNQGRLTMWSPTSSGGYDWFDFSTQLNSGNSTVQTIDSTIVVRFIFEDRSGRIWIGHSKGVTTYYKNRWHALQNTITKTHFGGTVQPDVISITQDRLGQVWFGTAAGGASLYTGRSSLDRLVDQTKTDTLVKFDQVNAGSPYANAPYWITGGSVHVNQIYVDKFDMVWFLTSNRGISYASITNPALGWVYKNVFPITNTSNGTVNNFRHVFEDMAGNTWFSTDSGIVRKDAVGNWRLYNGTDLSSTNVYKGFQDRQGRVWFISDNGIMKWDIVNGFNKNNPSLGKDITDFFEASDSTLWFINATDGGVMSLDRFDWDIFTGAPYFTPSAQVLYMFEDSNRTMLFSTDLGDVSAWNSIRSDWTITSVAPGTPLIKIYEDFSTYNYKDWLLGLNSINPVAVQNNQSLDIVSVAKNKNIVLATDLLDIWSKTHDWVLLERRWHLIHDDVLNAGNPINSDFALYYQISGQNQYTK